MENGIVVELRLVKDQKSTKAIGTVIVPTAYGDLTIFKVRVIHQDNKDAWVALPQVDYKDKNTGESKHAKVLELSARLHKAVSDAVLSNYRELLGSGLPF
jgi:hypothetical protein